MVTSLKVGNIYLWLEHWPSIQKVRGSNLQGRYAGSVTVWLNHQLCIGIFFRNDLEFYTSHNQIYVFFMGIFSSLWMIICQKIVTMIVAEIKAEA